MEKKSLILNVNEAFISEFEKEKRICGIYGVVNTKIGILKRRAWNS